MRLTAPVGCSGEAPNINEDMRLPIPENMPCDDFSG